MRAPLAGRLAQVVETQTSIARAGLDAGAVLRLVAAQAKELTGADGAAVVVSRPDGLGVRSAAGSAASLITESHPAVDAIAARALESGLATVWPEVDRGLAGRFEVGSAAAVPVRGPEGRLGALVATAAAAAAFAGEDVQVLQLLAGLAAAALGGGSGQETRQKGEAERFAHMSTHDALTLLPNRALLGDRLRHALTLARRHRARLCVMIVDLAGFGELNEKLGTAAGDAVLREVGDRLRAAVREPDTVARLAADEFVLLLAGDVTPEAARLLEGRIQQSLEAPVRTAGRTVAVQAAVGVAFYPYDGDDAETLIARAEAALLS